MITNVYFECTRDELNVLKAILNEVKDIEWASAYNIDEFDLCCGHFDIAYDENRFNKKENVMKEKSINILESTEDILDKAIKELNKLKEEQTND